MTLAQQLSEWLMWLGGGLIAVLTSGGAVLKRNRDRSLSNKRQLEGDPNDPNQEGVLEIAHETRERLEDMDDQLEAFREETRREHEQVMDRLEDIDDG